MKQATFTIHDQELAQVVNESLCRRGIKFRTTVYTDGRTEFSEFTLHGCRHGILRVDCDTCR